MYSKTKELICITGPDGSGKSTLINGLKDHFPLMRECTIWDALNYDGVKLFSSKQDVDQYLSVLTPDARLLFLAHALRFSLDSALVDGGDTILLNGYYYKYFTSELANGCDPELMADLTSIFPQPDRVIYLDTDCLITAERKKYFSRYECGGTENADKTHFLEFQRTCARFWKQFIRPEWHIIDGMRTADEVMIEVLNILKKR